MASSMEFLYSGPVDPEVVAQSCPTRLAVRKGRHDHISERASQEFQQQWKDAGGTPFWGCQSSHGSIIAFTLPECKPDRIPIITKLLDFLFAIDDMITSKKLQDSTSMRSSEPQGFLYKRPGESSISDRHDWETSQKQLYSKIMVELLRIDRIRGKLVIDALDQYRAWFGAKQANDIQSWDEWVQYRWEDSACHFSLCVIVFACELDVTQDDVYSVQHITWPGMVLTALSNDLHSFEVESVLDLQTSGNISNGVWRLMSTLDITAREAKHKLLTDKMKPLEEQFIQKKAAFLHENGRSSPHLAQFLELVELLVSGNWHWGFFATRYNRWRDTISHFGHLSVANLNIYTVDEENAKCSTYLQAFLQDCNKVTQEDAHLPTGIKTEVNEYADPQLDKKIVLAPVQYLQSLPSKNVRGLLIEALSSWFKIQKETLDRIGRIVSHLHSASLLLDDIEDQSPLRRGKPSAYRVFGCSQTINSANFLYVMAVEEVFQLSNVESHRIFLEEMKNLHIGQSHDIHWTQANYCPSLTEYLEMVRSKTGGLFCMLGRLIYAEAEEPRDIELDNLREFLILLGQFFQIRDDYINLVSVNYKEEKGFAEDLDEGKRSFPLIHLLQNSPDRMMIESILQQRLHDGKMSADVKELLLEKMKAAKSLDFTKETLLSFETRTKDALVRLEKQSGITNYILQYLIYRLSGI